MYESRKDVEGLTLETLWSLCYQAHSNTSFSPEKRATIYVKNYSKILDDDLVLLGDKQGKYEEKFISKFSDWMSAKGRCISSMITGPANFPVRRAQKANASENNRYNDFIIWRDKYFKAVNRVPTKSPEDELELAEARVESLSITQLAMKEINIACRKSKIIDVSDLRAHLLAEGYDTVLVGIVGSGWAKELKIPSSTLTNNNAKLKKAKEKVQIMKTRIERKNTWEDIKFEGGYVTIEDDRLKIYHDEKPSSDIIKEIKSCGYRWSPHWKCWCRKHTGNAVYSLKFLSFLKKD